MLIIAQGLIDAAVEFLRTSDIAAMERYLEFYTETEIECQLADNAEKVCALLVRASTCAQNVGLDFPAIVGLLKIFWDQIEESVVEHVEFKPKS